MECMVFPAREGGWRYRGDGSVPGDSAAHAAAALDGGSPGEWERMRPEGVCAELPREPGCHGQSAAVLPHYRRCQNGKESNWLH